MANSSPVHGGGELEGAFVGAGCKARSLSFTSDDTHLLPEKFRALPFRPKSRMNRRRADQFDETQVRRR
jgi:hypothetical protein